MKKISTAQEKVGTVPPGRRLETWKRKLEELKIACEQMEPTTEEIYNCLQSWSNFISPGKPRIPSKRYSRSTRATPSAHLLVQ